jgi:two-component system chemotaxis response regulator CheY
LPRGAHPKVVYLTSENDPLQVARVLRSGADLHMMKPFDEATFLRPLAEAGLV